MNTHQTLGFLSPILDELATLADGIREAQRHQPTPCRDFDVAALTGHTVGWLENFAAGFASEDGNCPMSDVDDVNVPTADAARRIRTAAEALTTAVNGGAAQRPLVISGAGMPGEMALTMMLGEYLIHGWDLAEATGQPWRPDEQAVSAAHEFLGSMVTADSRGEGGWFGPEVDVDEDAPALDRLVGFAGRDPSWHPEQV